MLRSRRYCIETIWAIEIILPALVVDLFCITLMLMTPDVHNSALPLLIELE